MLQDGSLRFAETGVIKKIWERWEGTLMGLQLSPYLCTQSFGWSKDFIKGDPNNSDSNPFTWDCVVLNLPGCSFYKLTKPWVYQTKFDESLAAFFGTYIDDIRTGDNTEKGCWMSTPRVASQVNYLRQQDASRKRRPPSKKPGAWAGARCANWCQVMVSLSCAPKKNGIRLRR